MKEQQEFYQTTFLPFKPLAEVAQDQIERALTESNKLGELLPSVQEAVTLTTCRISAVQTSLRKMNDMLANKATETKTGHPAEFSKVEPTAKAETIVKSETCRLQDQDGYKAPDPGPSLEPTQQSQEQVRGQGVSYELSQRRKSESAVAGRKQKLQRLRTVRSSEDTKYSQVDHDDSQLKSILKLRREHVEATADNINNRPN